MAIPEALKEFSIEAKSGLVIGAETVVGRVAARTLAEAGANLILASQEPGTSDKLKEVAKTVQAVGKKAVTQVQNATTRADLSATVDLTVKQLGGLDIMINVLDAPFYASAEGTDDSAFERILDQNLKTVWMACQEGSRVMLQRGGGVIVNVTSTMAQRGVPNASIYCAAKAAVLNLTRALALEWARKGIRVNALELGWLEDESSPAVKDPDFRNSLLKYLPYNRLMKPEEFAGALLYLVSPAAGFVTGESIAVDGGLLCRV